MRHIYPGNGCEEASITVNKPVTITVLDEMNAPYADLSIHAFDGETITGYTATTDANGQATLILPDGNYRFRANLRGTAFWSGTENHCEIPGCETASIGIPGGFEQAEVTIDYNYDPLYRLTTAEYSTGDSYNYTYDQVGNRLMQESNISGQPSAVSYVYDNANRLASVDGVNYTFDANGNLLHDESNTYTYDSANRLISIAAGPQSSIENRYNGLGDRIQQTVDSVTTTYQLDINSGLTQVLNDGTTSYTYGLGRISQQSSNIPEYFLGDALGMRWAQPLGPVGGRRRYRPCKELRPI